MIVSSDSVSSAGCTPGPSVFPRPAVSTCHPSSCSVALHCVGARTFPRRSFTDARPAGPPSRLLLVILPWTEGGVCLFKSASLFSLDKDPDVELLGHRAALFRLLFAKIMCCVLQVSTQMTSSTVTDSLCGRIWGAVSCGRTSTSRCTSSGSVGGTPVTVPGARGGSLSCDLCAVRIRKRSKPEQDLDIVPCPPTPPGSRAAPTRPAHRDSFPSPSESSCGLLCLSHSAGLPNHTGFKNSVLVFVSSNFCSQHTSHFPGPGSLQGCVQRAHRRVTEHRRRGPALSTLQSPVRAPVE